MIEDLKLNTTLSDIKDKIQLRIKKAQELQKTGIFSAGEVSDLQEKLRSWKDETIEILNGGFIKKNNKLVQKFRNRENTRYNIPGVESNLKQQINNIQNDIKTDIHSLEQLIILIEQSDILMNKTGIDWEKRKKLSINERLIFILKRLDQFNNGQFHNIKWILESNGIPVRNRDELSGLITRLKDLGYIETFDYGDELFGKISIDGISYLEEMDSDNGDQRQKDNAAVGSQQEFADICVKIDELVREFSNVQTGQEVLFNEMEELKALYLKLNKKNWRQIVMGKVVDLGLAKVIEKESLQFIYETLTQHRFNLLNHII